MKVLIADDHVLVRAGIRRLLDALPDVAVVGEADDGEQALELARRERPDIVLADISMPRLNGIDLSVWLARNLAQARVIILSMHETEDYVREALDAGARGYLLKRAAPEEIALALRAVAAGDVYLSPGVARHLLPGLQGEATVGRASRRPITQRQGQVLRLVALGLPTKEIAARLGISVRTVETHRADLMERLGVHDTVGLLREAARRGLIDLGS